MKYSIPISYIVEFLQGRIAQCNRKEDITVELTHEEQEWMESNDVKLGDVLEYNLHEDVFRRFGYVSYQHKKLTVVLLGGSFSSISWIASLVACNIEIITIADLLSKVEGRAITEDTDWYRQ